MKKNLAILMTTVLAAASLAACGSSSTPATTTAAATEAATTAAAAETTAAAEDTTAVATEAASEGAAEGSGEIVEVPKDFTTVNAGKLTVATSPDFAPYEFYHINADGTPELSGFDVALAKRIAEDLGLEVQFVPMDFDGILMELQSGNVDLGMAGFSPSPERADTFDFSDLYYKGGQSFVIRKADHDKYKDYAAFDKLPVGAQNGSIQMDLAKENTPNANIIGLAKVTDIVSELVSGKLEGGFIETAVAEQYIKNYPELEIAWDVPYDTKGSAIALKKGSDLLPAVNAVINNALSDGSMDQYVADAQELASDEGNVYEGQLDADGKVASN